jgi:hypothetical protein
VPGIIKGACLGGDEADALPGVAGVCELRVEPGLRTVSVIDDLLGPRAFYWQLSPPFVAARCAEGFADGTTQIVVPANCTEFSIYVEIGSTTGVVHVD